MPHEEYGHAEDAAPLKSVRRRPCYSPLDENKPSKHLYAVPTRFLSGEKDPVIGAESSDQLEAKMNATIADLREVALVPEVGHWVQQEAPQETTELLLRSLRDGKN